MNRGLGCSDIPCSPECRKRKLKCDEQQSHCGQCLRMGRACHLVDSLFVPHSSVLTSVSHGLSRRRPRASRSQVVTEVG
ncbi:hypothetical protein BDV06DRAFT_186867 [Aspergillus oleicola]